MTDAARNPGLTFTSRMSVKPQDLNPNGTLFGGTLLHWIDEECAIFAIAQVGGWRVVTKYMSEINFSASALLGEFVELGLEATHFGRSSVTLRCEAQNLISRETIVSIDRIVMVCLDEDGTPLAHGYTEPATGNERMPRDLPPTAGLLRES